MSFEYKDNKHYKLQRNVIGILGMILAPLSLALGYIGYKTGNNMSPEWFQSISQTFYSTGNVAMIGVLAMAGIFLCTYLASSRLNEWINRLIGIGFFGVAIFPCASAGIPANVGIFQLPVDISNILHFLSAGLAFILMGYNLIFLFTKESAGVELTAKKKQRNRLYRISGYGIWGCIAGVVICNLLKAPGYHVMIWEAIMLLLFGISWLTKGSSIKFLNDKE